MFRLDIGRFRYLIVADAGGIHVGQMNEVDPVYISLVLDFIQDAINEVRADCE